MQCENKRTMEKEVFWQKGQRQILVFRVGGDELGLDISCVREVLRAREVYRLPGMPAFIEGVISLRGHIVALFDLRKRLQGERVEEEPNGRIIICKANKCMIGLTVAGLREIVTLAEEDMRSAPEGVFKETEAQVFTALARKGERIIPILDLDHLVMEKEITDLSVLER